MDCDGNLWKEQNRDGQREIGREDDGDGRVTGMMGTIIRERERAREEERFNKTS